MATTDPAATPSTNPVVAATAWPTATRIRVSDLVLVKLDTDIIRPMLVTWVGRVRVGRPLVDQEQRTEVRVSGTIFCEPDDHLTSALRGFGAPDDPARFHGRPERYHTTIYGEQLAYGTSIGQWVPRPTLLPAS